MKKQKNKALLKFIEIDLLIAIAVLIILAIIGSFSYAASLSLKTTSPTSYLVGSGDLK
jgi:hypothetical protein